ncbi:hypothetical protein BDP27DRAFT_264262 [Rhodocollybia butyracea]|uniref:Uncharacterized protein n=1 Tax=Rhodocollybia butyracea TaxID=206335 RepID=A0A9P5UC52_9AGAR|nr:hypothetical protein BDP27DRAFT_264262 [Rhodocollybia butyracea]
MCDDSDESYTPPMRKKRRNSSSDKKPLPEDNTQFVDCTRLGRDVRVTRSSGNALGSRIKEEDSQVQPSTDNQDEESDSIQEGDTTLKRLYKRKKSPIIISDSPDEAESKLDDDDIDLQRIEGRAQEELSTTALNRMVLKTTPGLLYVKRPD